jgi:hypothetical protein
MKLTKQNNKLVNYIFLIIIIVIIIVIFIYYDLYNIIKLQLLNIDKFDNFKENKISISLGLLSYNAPDTLKQTLQTYKD